MTSRLGNNTKILSILSPLSEVTCTWDSRTTSPSLAISCRQYTWRLKYAMHSGALYCVLWTVISFWEQIKGCMQNQTNIYIFSKGIFNTYMQVYSINPKAYLKSNIKSWKRLPPLTILLLNLLKSHTPSLYTSWLPCKHSVNKTANVTYNNHLDRGNWLCGNKKIILSYMYYIF